MTRRRWHTDDPPWDVDDDAQWDSFHADDPRSPAWKPDEPEPLIESEFDGIGWLHQTEPDRWTIWDRD